MDAGGYRQIRVLSESAGEQVVLGRPVGDESAEPVVLRIVGEGRADAAVAVSGAVDSPHLAPILDLCALPGDRFGLVTARLRRGSLADLLARRPALAAGEAVTILVSVARGLAELHRHGFAHGQLRPSGVLFDAAGTPVLTSHVSGTALTPVTERGDGRALATLAATVLARVPGADAATGMPTQSEDGIAPKDLEKRLFDLGPPAPVEFPLPATPTIEQLLPSRTAPPETLPPAPPAGRVAGARASARARLARARAGLRTVRRRVWVPAVLTGLALVAAVILVPTGEAEPAAGAPDSRSSGSASAPATPPAFAAPDDASLTGDDPVAAARALAAGRDSCLGSGSTSCLDAVDQAGSGLLEADRAARGGQAPTLANPEADAVVQRTGDAALVAFGTDRLLLVRTEGEWRLRDVFAADAPGAP